MPVVNGRKVDVAAMAEGRSSLQACSMAGSSDGGCSYASELFAAQGVAVCRLEKPCIRDV